MPRRILRYKTDGGEERFAVYSTIVDDWVLWDMTEQEVIEWRLGRAAREAHEEVTERIADLRDGQNPYQHWDPGEKLLSGGRIILDTGVDGMKIEPVPNHDRVVAAIREAQTG